MNECCRRRCCKRKRCFWQKVRPVKNPSRATSLRPIPSDACAMTAVLLTTAAPSAARVRVASSSGRHPAPCATSSRPSRFAAPRASPDVSPASFSRLAKRGGTTRTRASAGRPPPGGTGGERLGDDNMRRGPPGAERDPYRAADGYEYDSPPPRGGALPTPPGLRGANRLGPRTEAVLPTEAHRTATTATTTGTTTEVAVTKSPTSSSRARSS